MGRLLYDHEFQSLMERKLKKNNAAKKDIKQSMEISQVKKQNAPNGTENEWQKCFFLK